MYGLAYCKLDYDYMYDLEIDVLSILLKAEIDKEIHLQDLEMQTVAWQTAYLMNATGNYKTPVKPEKLYVSLAEQEKKNKPVRVRKDEIQVKREELLKTFGITQ